MAPFGSGGTMSAEQIIEVAWSLKLSQHRFDWVLRSPADICVDAFMLV